MSTPGQSLLHTVALPLAVEAEQSVLGALLLDNACFDRVGDVLEQRDFGELRHRVLWVAISQLITAGKPADPITVHDRLVQVGKAEDAGGLEYVNALQMSVPSSSNVRRYAEIVRETSMRRLLVREAAQLLDATLARDDDAAAPSAVAEKAVERLLQLVAGAAKGSEPRVVTDVLTRFMDQLNDAAEGQVVTVRTGLRRIDDATAGGGRPGELWVIGARPSMGKSAFSQTLWVHVGDLGAALFLSQEDSDTMLVSRAVANRGRINLADLRNPQKARDADAMWRGVTEGVDDLTKRCLFLDDQGGLTLGDVRRKVQQAKRMAARAGRTLDLVIVDYLQLMTGEGDNRNQQLGGVANGMKALAKEQGVWIVLLSQLSREADRGGGVPQISHLRDSGDIEGAADVIMLLHREWQRNQKLPDEWKTYAEVHIAKQKNGPTCIVPLHFDGKHQRFTDWDGPEPQRPGRGGGHAGGGLS